MNAKEPQEEGDRLQESLPLQVLSFRLKVLLQRFATGLPARGWPFCYSHLATARKEDSFISLVYLHPLCN